MGHSTSLVKIHITGGCQLCETGTKIKWQCDDCSLLICDSCKKVHLKLAKDHQIVKSNRSSTKCQLCEKATKPKWRCQECNMLICDTCKKVHLKLAKDHQIFNIKPINIPTKCQLCKTRTIVNLKCCDCNMFICDTCEKVHIKLSQGHNIMSIKDIGGAEIKDIDITKIGFKVVKQSSVDTAYIYDIAVSPDGSLWIGDNKTEKLLHIRLYGDHSVTVLSTFNIKPYSLAIGPSGPPFVVMNNISTLCSVNELTGNITHSKFTIQPWGLTCVHVTRDHNIIMGGWDESSGFVVVMDKNGKQLTKFEKDNDKPFLTYPFRIATTGNRSIFIADKRPSAKRGCVAVIIQGGSDTQYYNGHPDINSDDTPLRPASMLVTPKDNILIMDYNTDCIHFLTNQGEFIAYYSLSNTGMTRPFSLALSPSGNIFIGSASNQQDNKATLYELEYSGI